jgi:hypothetical protein
MPREIIGWNEDGTPIIGREWESGEIVYIVRHAPPGTPDPLHPEIRTADPGAAARAWVGSTMPLRVVVDGEYGFGTPAQVRPIFEALDSLKRERFMSDFVIDMLRDLDELLARDPEPPPEVSDFVIDIRSRLGAGAPELREGWRR